MTAADLREALIDIEEALDIGRPVGAAELPDEVRFFRVLISLRNILCPRLTRIVQVADSESGDLAAVVADCIVSAVGNVPVPAATVAKHLLLIGFERFCSNPTELLSSTSNEPTPDRDGGGSSTDEGSAAP